MLMLFALCISYHVFFCILSVSAAYFSKRQQFLPNSTILFITCFDTYSILFIIFTSKFLKFISLVPKFQKCIISPPLSYLCPFNKIIQKKPREASQGRRGNSAGKGTHCNEQQNGPHTTRDQKDHILRLIYDEVCLLVCI